MDTDADPCHGGILSTGSCCIDDDAHTVSLSARRRNAAVQGICDSPRRFKRDSICNCDDNLGHESVEEAGLSGPTCLLFCVLASVL